MILEALVKDVEYQVQSLEPWVSTIGSAAWESSPMSNIQVKFYANGN